MTDFLTMLGFTVGYIAGSFIGLKLTNYIDWSWWWVLSPMWLPLAVILTLLGVVVLVESFTR